MRSLGFPELLFILFLFALLITAPRIASAGRWLGLRAKVLKWLWLSVYGNEEEEIRAEEAVGTDISAEFLRKREQDHGAKSYVGRLGDRLSGVVDAQGRRFEFCVLRDRAANACALPGGHVFITSRLADLVSGDDDSMAFFLAHEMAHILCHHFVDQTLVRVLSRAALSRGTLTGLWDKGFSRELEFEADLKAVDLMGQEGFDRQAALRALGKLKWTTAECGGLMRYLSTHPPVEERLERITRHLKTRAPRL